MEKSYIGIDVGAKGFIVIQSAGAFEFYALADYDLHGLADLFSDIAQRHTNCVAVIEDVRAVHGSSSTATFQFGQNKGMLLALLAAHKIPFEMVLPQTWQKAVWTPSDKVYLSAGDGKKKIDTKRTSFSTARRLFPAIDLRRNAKCKNFDDNKTDALLMSEYARRKNL